MTVPLTAIALDAGTQTRAAIDPQRVAEYAERMVAGDVFPPIVVFDNGGPLAILADGFHRVQAAVRAGLMELPAVRHIGSKDDALWYALGANRAHGVRMTIADKRHAVDVAFRTWPDHSAVTIAAQLGVSNTFVSKRKEQVSMLMPDRVVGKDGKSYPASGARREPVVHPHHDEIVARLKAGQLGKQIEADLHVRGELISKIRREQGMRTQIDTSRPAIQARHETIRRMAGEGYTSRQIAAAVQLGIDRVHEIAKRQSIDIAADRVVGKTNRHDSNRIVSRIVLEAENLTSGVDLITFADLDRAQVSDWIRSLMKARADLTTFIRQLQEHTNHGEAA